MLGIFRIDGPLYNFGSWIYRFFFLSFLWTVFSLPVFTIGAATTALFYVTHKWVAGEDTPIWGSFWKSFKENFRQATVIWIILGVLIYIIFINIQVAGFFGELSKMVYYLQLVALIELCMTAIYVFPLVARHHVTVFGGLRAAFFMANRHLVTTIMVVLGIVGLYSISQYVGAILLFAISLYGYWTSRLVLPVFRRYEPDEADKEDLS